VAPPAERTEKEFWENDYYWGDLELPSRPDPSQPFDRSVSAALAQHAPVARGKVVVEIGCAPAKWLLFYAERFGAEVVGIEYSGKGAALSRRNLQEAGVPGVIHEADFFAVEPVDADLLLSLGFIEHFEDLEATFARHVDYVKPGGLLVLGVPNFRGINGFMQTLADPAFLALHNTKVMSPEMLRSLATRHGLEELQLGYLGGIDPSHLRLNRSRQRWHPRRAVPAAYALAAHRWRRLAASENVNHRVFSTYLLGVWRRPDR
jgi:SAM-dependent methyltransferase